MRCIARLGLLLAACVVPARADATDKLDCDTLRRSAIAEARRAVAGGSTSLDDVMLAEADPPVEAAPEPVSRAMADRLLATLRSGPACDTSSLPLTEYLLRQYEGLDGLRDQLLVLALDPMVHSEVRASSIGLAASSRPDDLGWLPELLVADVDPYVANAVFSAAEDAAVLPRVLARGIALRSVSEDVHVKEQAAWMAWRHATDIHSSELLPVALLFALHYGSDRMRVVQTRDWGAGANRLLSEALAVCHDAGLCPVGDPRPSCSIPD